METASPPVDDRPDVDGLVELAFRLARDRSTAAAGNAIVLLRECQGDRRRIEQAIARVRSMNLPLPGQARLRSAASLQIALDLFSRSAPFDADSPAASQA
jgi:hypothetical protein